MNIRRIYTYTHASEAIRENALATGINVTASHLSRSVVVKIRCREIGKKIIPKRERRNEECRESSLRWKFEGKKKRKEKKHEERRSCFVLHWAEAKTVDFGGAGVKCGQWSPPLYDSKYGCTVGDCYRRPVICTPAT